MSGYLSRVFEYAVPCLLFWGVLAVSVSVDRSRFRNCIYLLLAAASSAPLFVCCREDMLWGRPEPFRS